MKEPFGPMLEVARIQSEINRLFDNLLDLGGTDEAAAGWIPNADILENEESLLVKVELPGVRPEELKVSVHGGDVIVQGRREAPPREAGARVVSAERRYGAFRRVIHLELPVNTHQAEAVLAEGLLRIRFPKVPNRRGREVPIEVKSS